MGAIDPGGWNEEVNAIRQQFADGVAAQQRSSQAPDALEATQRMATEANLLPGEGDTKTLEGEYRKLRNAVLLPPPTKPSDET